MQKLPAIAIVRRASGPAPPGRTPPGYGPLTPEATGRTRATPAPIHHPRRIWLGALIKYDPAQAATYLPPAPAPRRGAHLHALQRRGGRPARRLAVGGGARLDAGAGPGGVVLAAARVRVLQRLGGQRPPARWPSQLAISALYKRTTSTVRSLNWRTCGCSACSQPKNWSM